LTIAPPAPGPGQGHYPPVGGSGGAGSGIDWGKIHGEKPDTQPGAAQINSGGCGEDGGGGSVFNRKGKEGKFKGGKKNKRDRDFGIQDKKFWDWWHKFKQKYGYPDIETANDAWDWYDQWKHGSR